MFLHDNDNLAITITHLFLRNNKLKIMSEKKIVNKAHKFQVI